MSIGTHVSGNAGSTGPAPGPGLALGLDSPPRTRGKGQDFATIMRDLPPSASDKARQAVAKHADKKSDVPAPDDAADNQEVVTEAVADDENIESDKPRRAAKSSEKGEKKSPDTVEQPSELAAVALAVPVEKVAEASAEPTDEAVATAEGAKARKPVAQVPASVPQITDDAEDTVEGDPSFKEAMHATAKGATEARVEIGKAATKIENAAQPEVKAGPADKGEDAGAEQDKASRAFVQSSELKAPAKPGEATELLSLAKGKAEPAAQTKAADVALLAQAKMSAAAALQGDDAGDSQAADAKSPVVPVRGQGILTPQDKTIEGLQNAAAKAAPNSAVIERVAPAGETDAKAAAAKAAPSAAARAFEPPHVSALALAAADIAQKGSREGQEKDPGRTTGLLGDIVGSTGRSDVSSLLTRLEVLGGGSLPPQASAMSSLGGAGATGLAGALGQQVVDMGVSGHWIEDIAQQIARVADNPGQGAFRVSSPSLGAVQVNITPGSQGANIAMTVESEAARVALANDRQRLVQDAQLASVRIGEVRIDRVGAPGEAHRGDMNQNNQQGQAGAQHNGAQASLSQGNGQHGRADASAMGQQSGQDSTKNPFTKAVINDAAASDRANSGKDKRGDNARYA